MGILNIVAFVLHFWIYPGEPLGRRGWQQQRQRQQQQQQRRHQQHDRGPEAGAAVLLDAGLRPPGQEVQGGEARQDRLLPDVQETDPGEGPGDRTVDRGQGPGREEESNLQVSGAEVARVGSTKNA